MTILKIVWPSRRADPPRCAHFSTDICCVIQEGVIRVEIGRVRGEPYTRGNTAEGGDVGNVLKFYFLLAEIFKNFYSLSVVHIILYYIQRQVSTFSHRKGKKVKLSMDYTVKGE